MLSVVVKSPVETLLNASKSNPPYELAAFDIDISLAVKVVSPVASKLPVMLIAFWPLLDRTLLHYSQEIRSPLLLEGRQV